MFLNSGRAIAEKIQCLIDEEVAEPIKMAVAFWGAGADYKLRGRCRIICDLESGACNPTVIRALRKRNDWVVLKLKGLHAKVVIGSGGAVVSSANMSTNGLGAEGDEASGTIEAGYFVSANTPDYRQIVTWFDEVWNKATDISEPDLVRAQEKWDFRNREMPALAGSVSAVETESFDIDPHSLVEQTIDTADRLRAVKPFVFNCLSPALPGMDHRRQGKIATWACHLLLNRAGIVLDHSAGDDEPRGPATDEWIVGRFGKQKRDDTIMSVVTVLNTISRSPDFSADIRRAASQVLSARPWLANTAGD